MYRILIVDDEAKIRLLIRKYAEFEGHEVTEAENGMEAVRLFRKTPDAFDIVIMDVMMPELDGFSAVAEIKKIASPAVIMLSARGEEYDKIHGFELGVDDYVVKPFSPKELMMRVAAVMSRVQRTAIPKHELFRAEGLTIDFTGRIVTVDGVRADLSPKEYDLLFYMVNNRNIALTREMLITNVWGYDFYGDDRTLDTHIKLLRRQLGTPCIRTVHRLDAATGGVMVFARSAAAASILSGQVRDHQFRKTYLAVVRGDPGHSGTWRDLLGRDPVRRRTVVAQEPGPDVRPAELDFQRLASRDGLSLVRITLHTGRTHQIRVQFASRGFPLVGDRKYGGAGDGETLALWSWRLGFTHPETGRSMVFTHQPPAAWPWTLFPLPETGR